MPIPIVEPPRAGALQRRACRSRERHHRRPRSDAIQDRRAVRFDRARQCRLRERGVRRGAHEAARPDWPACHTNGGGARPRCPGAGQNRGAESQAQRVHFCVRHRSAEPAEDSRTASRPSSLDQGFDRHQGCANYGGLSRPRRARCGCGRPCGGTIAEGRSSDRRQEQPPRVRARHDERRISVRPGA